jgi:filamentous hemagglutinin
LHDPNNPYDYASPEAFCEGINGDKTGCREEWEQAHANDSDQEIQSDPIDQFEPTTEVPVRDMQPDEESLYDAYLRWLAPRLQPDTSLPEHVWYAGLTVAVIAIDGMMDIGRIGEGTSKGTKEGYKEDAKRLLAFALMVLLPAAGRAGRLNMKPPSKPIATEPAPATLRATASPARAAQSSAQAERLRLSLAADEILNTARAGSGLKADPMHRVASFVSREQLQAGRLFNIRGNDGIQRHLLQTIGEVNGRPGIFEFIVDPSRGITHQRFIPNGRITGVPNQHIP